MRQELITAIHQFNVSEIDFEQFYRRLNEMLKSGIREHLTTKQREQFEDFFRWYVDKYRPELQPRRGVIGRVKDTWDQVFKGEYRVSLDDVRDKSEELERDLK